LNLSWDFDNKLRSADIDANGSADVNFQYDALGRRVARTGTGGSVVFVQMDQQTIADYPVGGAASTPTYRYVYASYIDEPVVRKGAGTGGTIHYYHRNQQYSVTAITTAAGAIAERYAYTAYGLPTILNASATIIATSAISNRYTYTGREWDATLALHHFRARWMSPIAGRFIARDPVGYLGSKFNLFEFVRAHVLVRLDPKGLDDGDVDYCKKAPNPCAGSLEDYLTGTCWFSCLEDLRTLIGGGGPLQGNATAAGQACANAAFPPTAGNPNPVENQAIRHCVATAYLRCNGKLTPLCSLCLANRREDYQRMCSDQSCSATLRAKNNNTTGASNKVSCGSICDDCVRLYREGKLDTSPELPDEENTNPWCKFIPTKGNSANPGVYD
jgi:RHS repeat-associated protein